MRMVTSTPEIRNFPYRNRIARRASMNTMRRSERYLWNALLLASPLITRLAIADWSGNGEADRMDWVLGIWFVCAISLALSGQFAWIMARAIRVAVLPIRRWANRRWRWALYILPEAVLVGSERIWVSRELASHEREQLGRITEALDVLRELAPGRIARMHRIGIALVVAPIPTKAAATFLPSANIIVISPGALAESAPVLASLLVHELNHARVDERGLLNTLHLERLERLARVDQYHFGYRLHLRGLTRDAERICQHVIDTGGLRREARATS
jgi:hypothetical protein